MTVQELIDLLSEMPKDTEVVCNLSKNELANGKTVKGVEYVNVWKYKNSSVWKENYYDVEGEYGEYSYSKVVNVYS